MNKSIPKIHGSMIASLLMKFRVNKLLGRLKKKVTNHKLSIARLRNMLVMIISFLKALLSLSSMEVSYQPICRESKAQLPSILREILISYNEALANICFHWNDLVSWNPSLIWKINLLNLIGEFLIWHRTKMVKWN